jgi:NAD(P)-dependent dehydrogenase (short-subunit alcohol dehydrogenase family)
VRKRFEFRDAVCVVTGASSGLGRQFALDLAARGSLVVGIARRRTLLDSLEEQLRSSSPRSRTVDCDVSDTDAFCSVLASVESDLSRIDLLVNCAGVPEPSEATFSAGTEALVRSYRGVFDTNFFGAVAGTLAVVPGMVRRDHGVVVNVSSDSGRAPGPGEPGYCASKAALSAFTESLALSIDGTGVRLHILYPGWVPTAMGNGAVDAGMPIPPKFVRRTAEQVSELLLRKLGAPRIDIDAAFAGRLAPASRAIAPALYKKGVLASSGDFRQRFSGKPLSS